MSDDNLDIDVDDDGNEFVRVPVDQAKNQRELARKAKENEAAALERDAAKRELAFLKAGIDTDSPVGKLFTKAYDGELTAEAIKAAASEIGLTQEAPAEPPAEQPPSEEELHEQRLRQQLAQGTGPGQTPPPDPRQEAKDAVKSAKDNGDSDEKALASGFAVLREAATRGDDRVIIDVFGNRNSA